MNITMPLDNGAADLETYVNCLRVAFNDFQACCEIASNVFLYGCASSATLGALIGLGAYLAVVRLYGCNNAGDARGAKKPLTAGLIFIVFGAGLGVYYEYVNYGGALRNCSLLYEHDRNNCRRSHNQESRPDREKSPSLEAASIIDDPYKCERAMGVDETLIQTWEEGIRQAQPLLPDWTLIIIGVAIVVGACFLGCYAGGLIRARLQQTHGGASNEA